MAASPTTGTSTGVLTNQVLGDSVLPFNKGRQGEQWVSKVHGDYYNQTIGGQMFCQTTSPLGAAFPLYTTTAIGAASISGLPLWNTSTTKNVVITRIQINRVSGTSVTGSIFLMARTGMGTTAGTGSPFAVFLTTTPRNCYLGSGNASLISSYGGIAAASATLTTLGAVADIWQSLAQEGAAADATTNPASVCDIWFPGNAILAPGSACWIAATAATVALYTTTITWYEAPIPQ